MFKVRTKLGRSEIHGIGLFADEDIPKGGLIYEEGEFTVKFSKEKRDSMPEIQRKFLDAYAPFRDGHYYISIDDDRFMNHSESPNTHQDGACIYATVDIANGQELTCDYETICEHFRDGVMVDP